MTTEYYLNGSTILTQITGNDRLDFLYDDAGSLLGLKWNGQSYYYVKNLQGDIIGILDSDGNQVVEYVYESWGQHSGAYGSMTATLGELNPFRYRGYYYDTESGFYYLNSRYYDPEIGRFLNADKYMGLKMNLYEYCYSNSINWHDPTGNVPEPINDGPLYKGILEKNKNPTPSATISPLKQAPREVITALIIVLPEESQSIICVVELFSWYKRWIKWRIYFIHKRI